MTDINTLGQWISIAHLPKWRTKRINELIVTILHEKEEKLADFFNSKEEELADKYNLNEKEIADVLKAKSEIPSNSFLAESILNQGFELLPIYSPEYPQTLKNNLKRDYAPPLLYIKGNKQILRENSAAVVGSRKASDTALDFTDKIVKTLTEEYRVIVSGFAKGVDKLALDSALKYNGQSIVVLPQGILTFSTKKYYKQIIDGNVLILSTFFPKVPWSVGLAMARNTYIYGLAKDIYVAESDSKGGTWSGVVDGLRKGRTIYIRKPDENEKNANQLLIDKGAIPVDTSNLILDSYKSVGTVKEVTDDLKTSKSDQGSAEKEVEKIETEEISDSDIVEKAIEIIKTTDHHLSSNEIISLLNINISARKLTSLLKKEDRVKTIEGKPIKFDTVEDKKAKPEFDEENITEMKLNETNSKAFQNSEKAAVELVSLSFDKNDCWKVIYKGQLVEVKITDKDFWNKIDTGEVKFSKGDTLKIKLSTLNKNNKKEYIVVKVTDHISAFGEPGLGF